jgi:hypothetical protein
MTTLTIASMYAVGTDCEDCGPVGFSNFTVVNDDNFWDYSEPGDDEYAEMCGNTCQYARSLGSIFFAIAAFFMYRCYKGESLPLSAETELDLVIVIPKDVIGEDDECQESVSGVISYSHATVFALVDSM